MIRTRLTCLALLLLGACGDPTQSPGDDLDLPGDVRVDGDVGEDDADATQRDQGRDRAEDGPEDSDSNADGEDAPTRDAGDMMADRDAEHPGDTDAAVGTDADATGTSDADATGTSDADATGTSDADAIGTSDADAIGTSDADATGTSDADAAAPDAEREPDVPSWSVPPRPAVDPSPAGVSWRYGGGVGYPDVVSTDWPVVTVVDDAASLASALAGALPGDIVYVDDDAQIDLTGISLCVSEGVWLASGRGYEGSPGGLLYATDISRPLIGICGDDVRITGLRILGADAGECPAEYPDACTGEDRTGGLNCRDCTPSSFGIQSRGYDRLEVDNCELAGWSYAAIWLAESIDNLVHHNDIHHTQRQGLGYGVVLTRGGDERVTVDVAWNRFDYNRHVVAGSGEHGQDYIARDNLIGTHSIGHVFDMHGEAEGGDPESTIAGGLIEIYRNTVLVADQYAMVIRGRPDHGAYLYDNCLARDGAGTAALQRFHTGNFFVDSSPEGAAPNTYGADAADCQTVRWCTADAGVGPWAYAATSATPLSSLGFGDFDGDGRLDVFRSSGGRWQVVDGAQGSWRTLNTSSYLISSLRFADFDGDGKTDIFRASGSQWFYSSGGTGSWTALRSATDSSFSLRFADLDGDAKADAVRTTGTEIQWSNGGTEAWTRLRDGTETISELGFGDFDGDGSDDLFRATGSEWQWASEGTGTWTRLNASGTRVGSLRFTDLDGDGRTDVFRASADHWNVSWAGVSGWDEIRIVTASVAEVFLGDFDGDGRADAFRTGCL